MSNWIYRNIDTINACLFVSGVLVWGTALVMWMWFVLSIGEKDGKIVWVGFWENLK